MPTVILKRFKNQRKWTSLYFTIILEDTFWPFVSFVAQLFGLKETFSNLWPVSRITQSSVFKLLGSRRIWLINFFCPLYSPFPFTPSHPPLESPSEGLLMRNVEEFKFNIPLYI